MRKIFVGLLMLLMLVCVSCGKEAQPLETESLATEALATEALATEPTETEPLETEIPETEPLKNQTPQQPGPEQTTTLMVYMVGSDLEARAGAATRDLEEMAQSGVDLSKHQVVVYAGGSPYWHNEAADPQCNTVLQLTEQGFVEIATFPSGNMGESKCLAEFLNYVTQNFSSERYALILWDHGNGPVMGYGKDMLYQDDSLLLEEMRQAMEATSFGKDNKLCWVGFDACLMASAELSCLWADYADYLVASQEVEPSFGWNYEFLEGLGNSNVPEFLTGVTQCYMEECLAYYEERGYSNRDTTLSCVDLSKAEELETALNALFASAIENGQENYAALAACRSQARALGRSSTGSEYDLVDVQDLATRLEALYPAEAAQVNAVLEQMVVANTTNTVGCCGISMYFPFYNKYYYEHGWQETYSQLNCLPEYQQYLKAYEENWLAKEKLPAFSKSFTGTAQGERYTLELTKEQQESYASARYYILRQEGDELYRCVFVGTDVTRNGNTVTANFPGKVLKIKTQNSFIPPSAECGKIGDLTYYFIPFFLRDLSIGFENSIEVCYHVVLNDQTGEVSICALQPGLSNMDETTLMGGKLEDVDLSQWERASFFDLRKKHLTRDENGAILPMDQWQEDSWISGRDVFDLQNMQVVYEPLDEGTYYLMLEIQDVRGDRFCSEPMPVELSDAG